jgi:hypothetical protein
MISAKVVSALEMKFMVPRYASAPAMIGRLTPVQAVTIVSRPEANTNYETVVGRGLLVEAGRAGANWVAGMIITSPVVVVPAVIPILQITILSP